MKKIVDLTLYCAFIFMSCSKTDKIGVENYHEYWINNQSNKNVILKLYKMDNSLHSTIHMKPDSVYLIETGIEDPAFGQTFFITNRLDSAIFTFDDGKILIQTYLERGINDTINNVLSASYYQIKSNDKNKKIFTFNLKQSDYTRAK